MSRTPKVFMFLHKYYFKDARVQKEAKTLARNAFDITVFCLRENNEVYSEKTEGVKIVTVRKMKENQRKTPLGMIFFWFSLLKTVWKEKEITIIHAHDLTSLPPGVLLKLFKKTRFLVFDAHEQFSDAVYDYFGLIPFSITQIIENFCTKKSDLFIGVMQPQIMLVKKRLRNFSDLDYSYIPNYPQLEGILAKPHFHERNEVFKLIYLGSMEQERCYDQLIDAAKILREINYAFEIIIIGNGPMFSHTFDRVNNENLNDVIKLKGYLPREEALRLTREGDAGLILVEPQRNMQSIMPNKFFEYLQLGLGLISVRANGIGSYMKKIFAVSVENPMDPESIAQAILTLSNDEEKRKKIIFSGQKYINDKWNWISCEKTLLNSYRRLLKVKN